MADTPNRISIEYGFPNYYVGDQVEFIDRSTLNTVSEPYTVVAVENPEPDDYDRQNRKVITLTLDRPIPEEVRTAEMSNYVVENITYTPEVEIRNCVFDQSPVRGILCTTRKKVVIEDNIFRNMNMSSIFVSDDANGWYESGYCRDITIRNNVFELCNTSSINFGPIVNKPDIDNPLHKNLLIEGNTFLLKDKVAIYLKSVENVTIRNNTFLPYEGEVTGELRADNQNLLVGGNTAVSLSTSTPRHTSATLSLEYCKNVTIEGNSYGEGINRRVSVSNMPTEEIHTTEVDINRDRYEESIVADAAVEYRSTDDTVVTVGAKSGQVKAVGVGEADVYAVITTADGKTFESDRVTMTVTEPAEGSLTGISVTAPAEVIDQAGGTLQMEVSPIPSDAACGTVTWEVLDPESGENTSIATIDQSGLLTAHSSGIVEVRAQEESGFSHSKLVSIGTGSSLLTEILYPVDGQIVSVEKDRVVQKPSQLNGFFDPRNQAENLITFQIPDGTESYEAVVKLTGEMVSTYEEAGFGILKDQDSYVSVSNKHHLGTLLVTETGGDGDESICVPACASSAYLKIVKNGDLYTGYYRNADSEEWTTIGEATVALGNDGLRLAMWSASRVGDHEECYTWEELNINGEPQSFLRDNAAPAAAEVTLTESGEQLTAAYQFSDSDSDGEGNTRVYWYTSDSADGVYRRIANADGTVLPFELLLDGSYVKAAVVPVDELGMPGEIAWSSPYGPVEKEPESEGGTETPSIDTRLGALSVGANCELFPEFDGTAPRYITSAEDSNETISFHCRTEDKNATMMVTVNGDAIAAGVSEITREITLLSGFNMIYVDVTAEDKTTQQQYKIIVVRPGYESAELASLVVNDAPLPGFGPAVTEYELQLEAGTELKLNAQAANDRTRVILSDGKTTVFGESAAWTVPEGISTYVVALRSESYGTYTYYTIKVKTPDPDNANLDVMRFDGVSWTEEWNPETTEYTGSLFAENAAFAFSAADLGATIRVSCNGSEIQTAQGSVSGTVPLQVGENTVTAEVTAENGNTRTYTFRIERPEWVYLSDLNWASAEAGYDTVRKDAATEGKPIQLTDENGDAVLYQKGIGTHADSTVVYDLKGLGVTRFSAAVGVDFTQKGSPASVVFKVYLNTLDSTPVYTSQVMRGNTPQEFVDISIGADDEKLILVVDKYDSNSNDHSNWANAMLYVTEDAHTHTLSALEEKEVTCTEGGNIACWYCEGCGKYFSDEQASVEIPRDEAVIPALGHAFGEEWASDENGHWHKCTRCGAADEVQKHVPGPEATETEPQVCTVCGYIIAPPTGHVEHTPSGEWSYDDAQHWHVCTVCQEKLDVSGHTWVEDEEQTTAEEKVYTCFCGAEKREELNPVTPPPRYAISVTAGSNGTVTVAPKRAEAGETVTITATPAEGYEVDTIQVTAATGSVISVSENRFKMPSCSVKVNVTFRKAAAINPFADVEKDDWFFEAVMWACENDVMAGVGGGKFAPDGAVSRAMVWTVLARMDGQDISGSDWAEQAQAWAVAEGVSDGTAASESVTREQLATMLYRYLGEPAVSGSLSGYPDTEKVSDWAAEAMNWAVQNKIITGMNGTLNPQGGATRSQLVTMLMRFDGLDK